MLQLKDVPAFSALSPPLLQRIEDLMELQTVPAFSTVCRRGDPGRFFYVVAAGGVTVNLGAGSRKSSSVYMGPGQVFGEMSLIADMPVSATVRTVTETRLYRLSKEAFLHLFHTEPEIHRGLIEILVERLRHRSDRMEDRVRSCCCFVVSVREPAGFAAMREDLYRAIQHYSPGSVRVDMPVPGSAQPRTVPDSPGNDVPLFFPPRDTSGRRAPLPAMGEYNGYASDEWIEDLLSNWRSAAGGGQVLLVFLPVPVFSNVLSMLEPDDSVIAVTDHEGLEDCIDLQGKVDNHAAFTVLKVDDREGRTTSPVPHKWYFRTSPREAKVDRSLFDESYRPDLRSAIDWLARWVVQRELGLSLSAGAARGFAHLGVLQVLENAGVPIDCISGTSMGGIVALVYAMTGSAEQSVHVIRELLGGNRKVRDLALLPRGSLYSGTKVARAARAFFGDTHIADLKKPCAVIAVDLVRGERLVIDQGPAGEAALCTSAIPGLFPAVERDGRLLIDGALMSRIPLDVLHGRRCGLRLAVNVVPSPETRKQEAEETFRWLKDRYDSFLGLRFIIGFSWELQAWTHGANEAEGADLLIEPDTHIYSGYNFDRFDEMVDAGRKAAEEKLDMINASVAALLKPGVP